ncbi:pyridoxal phosphate-dependent aminotransferase [Exiguobacterium alkaliphilum]|uniref:Histidinol-phosphate aminotransferase family protein n=1 Tax=Exiguobacterium alkaliphilum TaxID=1428684 RepID=A0ABT2L1W7_9BACL|nr:histidinol-phosphate transaminase [Exiguobacterium alkaliphilum]MCT4796754.1 histidinol-phosphate aminotransferase family protein [Exiguobacterium alkaliphilum]
MRQRYETIPRYVPHAVKGHALNQNESQYDLPERIQDKIRSIDLTGLSRYPVEELTRLKQNYAKYAGVDANQLMVGSGSDELLAILCQALLDVEDRVVAPLPDFSMYGIYTQIARGQFIQPDQDGLSFDSLIRTIEANEPKLVLVSNPNNPTGKMWTHDELETLASRVPYLVVDEAYIDFTMTDAFTSKLEAYPNVIILRTLSKAFGLANLRIGFMIADETLIANVDRFRSPFNVSGLSAAVAAVVLEDSAYIRDAVSFHNDQRQKLTKILQPVGTILPSRANFLYVQTPDSEKWADRFLRHGVHVRAFSDGIRVSAGTDEAYRLIQQTIEEVSSLENS